ncbi:hypothetical protein M413DRAFT_448223 [Hebeloma cylindrosporum]|uniref:Uncharacterized protein n=1 Tax=Hebeloma cylindrosporum TaxID=76867 RepID=A0A0C3C091_HEBCY|nr:hypothetical protein M413DRAFT_448223 [Hebeloma cylindrosporum h7]
MYIATKLAKTRRRVGPEPVSENPKWRQTYSGWTEMRGKPRDYNDNAEAIQGEHGKTYGASNELDENHEDSIFNVDGG